MKGARIVAFVASLGNLLQGWDNGAIAGGLLYIKPEFHLEDNPRMEGIVVASTLIGAVCSTICAGPGADWLGRKSILSISGLLFSCSSCIMLWAPNVYILIASRILVGTSIGLVVTIVPVYIAESAPSEIRGQLATFPQLLGSSGLFLVYIMVFFLSLDANPSWRFMLGVLVIPALVYLALVVFYLPESPRWLVSKGRMLEARQVLQFLRDKEDVSAELALLVEGLGSGDDTSLQEWLLSPAVDDIYVETEQLKDESQIKVFAAEEGIAWIATPVLEDANNHSIVSSFNTKSHSLLDPVVMLLGSFQHAQEHLQAEHLQADNINLEESSENLIDAQDGELMVGTLDDENDSINLVKPLLRKLTPPDEDDDLTAEAQDNVTHSIAHNLSTPYGSIAESLGSVGIGGGWQLAWQWAGPEGTEGNPEEGDFKRVFLLQEAPVIDGVRTGSSMLSLPGVTGEHQQETDIIPAAALIGHPAQYVKQINKETPVGPAMLHPAETALAGPAWSDLLVGGVRRALIVGISMQILQQLNGINAVLYFIPQILQQSGAEVVLANMGISSDSASILGSAVTSLFMLPCIVLAMRLMDTAGRRQLLLVTLPILFFGLISVIVSNTYLGMGLAQALVSFVSVTLYTCSFVMGFGPIPNILCSEIFPTRVRGLCTGICQAAFWISNIVVTYLFPIMLVKFGLGGVFSIFAVVCVISWFFIFLKVPETKGMPLEVISDFFAMTHLDSKKQHHHHQHQQQQQQHHHHRNNNTHQHHSI